MKRASCICAGHAFRMAVLGLGVAVCTPSFGQLVPPPPPVPGSPPVGHNPADDQQNLPGRSSKKKKKGEKKEEEPTITFVGTVLRNNGKMMVVHTPDGRWITVSFDADTKFLKDDLTPLDQSKFVETATVQCEAAEDDEFYLTALTLQLKQPAVAPQPKPATKEAKADDSGQTASEDDDAALTNPKSQLDVPDAPDRPTLTRRHSISSGLQSVSNSDASSTSAAPAKQQAKAKPASDEQQDFTIGLDAPPKSASRGGPGADVLQRSMNWAETFDQGLPNYLCREVTTRYVQTTREGDWNPQDVVTANIVYQDGQEQQRDVMVGNKKVADISKTGGSWSTGEFATMLHSLFQPTRDTDFRFDRPSMIHDIATAEFDFGVPLLNSDWSIIMGGQVLRPKYTGTLWVEKNTGIVRRLEQEARSIPKDFPLDEVQTSIEYEEVSLGTQKFLLPVKAENIACERGTTTCTKNVIEFRDYHKFSGESTIEFH